MKKKRLNSQKQKFKQKFFEKNKKQNFIQKKI